MAVGSPPETPPPGLSAGGGATVKERLLATADQLENSAKVLRAQAQTAQHAADECRNAANQWDG